MEGVVVFIMCALVALLGLGFVWLFLRGTK